MTCSGSTGVSSSAVAGGDGSLGAAGAGGDGLRIGRGGTGAVTAGQGAPATPRPGPPRPGTETQAASHTAPSRLAMRASRQLCTDPVAVIAPQSRPRQLIDQD